MAVKCNLDTKLVYFLERGEAQPNGKDDWLNLIEYAGCALPDTTDRSSDKVADCYDEHNEYSPNTWATCKQPGYYIGGLRRGGGGGLDNLDWFRCCKPRYVWPDLKKIAEEAESKAR
jgi:hypothetical protein